MVAAGGSLGARAGVTRVDVAGRLPAGIAPGITSGVAEMIRGAAFVAAVIAAVTLITATRVISHTDVIVAASKKAAVRLGTREEIRQAGWADRPAGATRSQPPPIARAVDFARDRRFVRREGRVVRRVVRWEPPAAGFGEHHREVEEHRISGSLHRPESK